MLVPASPLTSQSTQAKSVWPKRRRHSVLALLFLSILFGASVRHSVAETRIKVHQITVPVERVAFYVQPEEEDLKTAIMSGLDASNHLLVAWGLSTSDSPDYGLVIEADYFSTEFSDCISQVSVKFGGFNEEDYFESYFTISRMGASKCVNLKSRIKLLTEEIMTDLIPAIADGNRPRELKGQIPEADLLSTNEFASAQYELGESRDREQTEQAEALGHLLGCALGGTCGNPEERNLGRKVLTDRPCNSGLDCPINQKCMKPEGSYGKGTCAVPVNDYGLEEVSPPETGMREVPACTYDSECPLQFKCSKQGTSYKGICIRR